MNQVREFLEYIFNAIKVWVIVQPWENGLRVRNGKKVKKLKGGIFFRLPYFDSIYIQEIRLRVTETPMQTLTSSDNQTITLNSSFGYVITDLEKLYNTLYQPEKTLQNIVMSELANIVWKSNMKEVSPEIMENKILSILDEEDHDYGVKFEYFKITNFAIVKTLRLIQDQSWISEGLDMTDKK